MELVNAPSKIVEAFAAGGGKNVIPVPSQIPITPGAASWTDGFPPATRTAVEAGGVPPSGLDMNGVLFALSALSLWFNAGASFVFDATFAANVGGYPKGAQVLRADGTGLWLSTVDNNSSNPDTGGSGWVAVGNKPVASVYASTSQTLATGSTKVLFDTVEFDAAGLWNAGSKRFVATNAGKYRISGAVLLAAPGGQLLSISVAKNGAIAKRCSQFPQVSDGDLTFNFDAIINCASGDYMEVFMSIPSTSVTAGVGGSNQQYVFAQAEYIGQ